MNAKDASKLVVRLLGIATIPPSVQKDLDNLMELIMNRPQPKQASAVKDETNDIKPEENTIDLQTIDHFDMPEEMNVSVEGNEAVHKIKIFPDGMSETPVEEEAVPSTAK
jgi:hypothetical protein